MTESEQSASRGVSRRGLFGLVGAGAAAGLAAGAGGASAVALAGAAASSGPAASYPFFGRHQAGITTPMQDRLHFAAYDLTGAATRDGLIQLLQEWSAAAERLTRGLDVTERGAVNGPALLPPDDTGEAQGLPANGLTITIGLGPSLFDDRFGLGGLRPDDLRELPLFAFDLLDPAISGGDLCIQACANDPQVAVHAIRNLTRIAFGTARIRWSQLGFGRTSSTSSTQATPRNLFGYKDGTANIKAEERRDVDEFVWVGDDGDQAWMSGGSYLVTRRILMTIESWDRVKLEEQDQIIGRDKGEGAPLSDPASAGGTEFTEPDFDRMRTDGTPAIPANAHVRLAHPKSAGTRILRRGYNFVDGSNDLGQLNAGLFFMSYQRSPQQFIDVQAKLADDPMNEYIRHVGSALFAVPPGASSGGWVGETLF
jgi:deferrochelatase/peroxidase EfeB